MVCSTPTNTMLVMLKFSIEFIQVSGEALFVSGAEGTPTIVLLVD